MSGWIGVDLDGTLAHYTGWKGNGEIGAPIPEMVKRVQAWLDKGYVVKVFTARVHNGSSEIWAIQQWCFEHIGTKLEVTATKDFSMIELWDDRCVAVEKNTGRVLGGDRSRI